MTLKDQPDTLALPQNRRKAPPKRRVVKKERREDMLIISSASQADIYTWTLSIALMVGILTALLILSLH